MTNERTGTMIPKYSIITIASNQIDLTIKCVETVFKNTKDFDKETYHAGERYYDM